MFFNTQNCRSFRLAIRWRSGLCRPSADRPIWITMSFATTSSCSSSVTANQLLHDAVHNYKKEADFLLVPLIRVLNELSTQKAKCFHAFVFTLLIRKLLFISMIEYYLSCDAFQNDVQYVQVHTQNMHQISLLCKRIHMHKTNKRWNNLNKKLQIHFKTSDSIISTSSRRLTDRVFPRFFLKKFYRKFRSRQFRVANECYVPVFRFRVHRWRTLLLQLLKKKSWIPTQCTLKRVHAHYANNQGRESSKMKTQNLFTSTNNDIFKEKETRKGRERGREQCIDRLFFFHYWAHLSKVFNYVSLSLVAQLGEKTIFFFIFQHTHI